MSGWLVVYKKAINDDGSLFFPEKLSREFLDKARKTMGSYLFANQYMNEVIPEDEQTFKPHWIRYYKELPQTKHTFAFIDPAISQTVGADYTGITVVDIDTEGCWYVRHARRERLTPTQIINLVFDLNAEYKPMGIGIESVAFQKAILYLLQEEMRNRGVVVPVKEVHPGNDRTKEMRIRGALVPRFEWGRILLAQGLHDLEAELSQFPRGSHDDIIDSLAQIEAIAIIPSKERTKDEAPSVANANDYESWYRRNIHKIKEGTADHERFDGEF